MENNKKKGFWASLFSPKPCTCTCGSANIIPAEDTGSSATSPFNEGCNGIKEIKVLGPGCAKCKSTYAVVEKVIEASGIDVQLTKVEDIEEIMRYNILTTPAIVADNRVVLQGRVPNEKELQKILSL